MNVPVLLGEDFQVNYKISILRWAQWMYLLINQPGEQFNIIAHSSPPSTKYFQVQPHHLPEIRNHAAYLATSRNPSNKPKHITPTTCLLWAATDMRIHTGWVTRVPIEGPTASCDEWFMEWVMLPMNNRCFLAAPLTLIKSEELIVAVANMSPSVEWIHKGNILGILDDPEQYLNRAMNDGWTQILKAYAQVVQKITRGLLGDKDLSDQTLAKSQALEIPPEPDGSDELWGPKMSEPADPTMYNSKKLEELINISPDTPLEIRKRTLALIHKHIQAYIFDDQLGMLDTVTRIHMKEEAQPVSMPMYGASPVNRQVIDEQMDRWIRQEVVEPLKVPGLPLWL
jgi:hypothetical protein